METYHIHFFLAPLPVNVTVGTVTTNTIALLWDVDPSSRQDGILVSYMDQKESLTIPSKFDNYTIYTMNGLSPGYKYSMNVYLVSGDVQSVPSSVTQFTGNQGYNGFSS